VKTYLGRGEKVEKEMSDEGPPDDKAIIIGLQHGDRRSANHLVLKYYKQLLLFLEHRMKAPRDIAEELVDDVFAKIFYNPALIRPGTERLGPFLYVVCRNAAIDWHRKRKKEEEMEQDFTQVVMDLLKRGEISSPWMESPTVFPERHIVLLRQSLSGLDRNSRLVLKLWAEGVPDRQVAGTLQENEGTIRQRRKRALEGVRERYLSQLDHEPAEIQAKIRKKLKLD
jgi:RNA polymerase sigma factor (sigma-70 family)